MDHTAQESAANAPHGAAAAHGSDALSRQARPTVADLHGENPFAQLARKHWLATNKTPKTRPEVIKNELWDELVKVDFAYSSLLILENLQLLERYLWPGFTEEASNYHHLLLALMVNVKRRENLPSWGEFGASFARHYANMEQNTSRASLPSSRPSFAASYP